jgi:hypothetical protein
MSMGKSTQGDLKDLSTWPETATSTVSRRTIQYTQHNQKHLKLGLNLTGAKLLIYYERAGLSP